MVENSARDTVCCVGRGIWDAIWYNGGEGVPGVEAPAAHGKIDSLSPVSEIVHG